MVLESLLTPEEAQRRPLDMLIIGFAVSSFALWLSYYVFPAGASAWVLFLTTLALVPLIHRMLAIEEVEDLLAKGKILKRHADIIEVYLFLFLGMVVSFSFWYLVLPPELTSVMFSDQIATLGVSFSSGAILVINLKLLALFIILSFLFGAGAVLLLTFNAAITGIFIGNLLGKAEAFATTLGVFSFMAYGIFEIIGFSLGAVGGGILSIAIIKKHYKSPYFKRVMLDVGLLIGLSVVFIVISSLVRMQFGA